MAITSVPDRLISERTREFFRSNPTWTRALWSPGIGLALQEALQAFESRQAGVLSDRALVRMAETLVPIVGTEPAFSDAEKKKLIDALKGNHTPNGVDFETVRYFSGVLSDEYLPRLAAFVKSHPNPAGERIARGVAAHLLDLGFSNSFLHRWSTFQIENKDGSGSLVNLIDAAAAIASKGEQRYEVLAAFDSLPESRGGYPTNYLTPSQVSNWLKVYSQGRRGVRQNGGLLLSVKARDREGAAAEAAEQIRLLESRCALGTKCAMKSLPKLWVHHPEESRCMELRLAPEQRSVEVHSLYREDKLYVSGSSAVGRVDLILELLATLKNGAPGAAVSSGWAAVEALVSGAGDQDSMAAKRLASIVACSYPRAELTTLAYKAAAEGGKLADRLNATEENKLKGTILVEEILAGRGLPLTGADLAALSRVKQVLADPNCELHRLQQHLESTLLRLYRYRNLVLHGGRTDAIGLRASLRTAAPIVGAGVDRISHAWFAQGCGSLELASRAEIGLATVGCPGGPSIVDLLE